VILARPLPAGLVLALLAWPSLAPASPGDVPDHGAPASRAHLTGPPPGHTGGFGEPDCTACHTGDEVNAYGGRVEILGLPDAWTPGGRYPLTVVVTMEETAAAGFQLSSRFPDGTQAGEFTPVDPRVTVTAGEGDPELRYAHHTEAGALDARADGSRWLVEWVAPGGANSGDVVFNVAGNSANGDNSPLLDLVYLAEVRVPAGG
jgi:hypothetical protein